MEDAAYNHFRSFVLHDIHHTLIIQAENRSNTVVTNSIWINHIQDRRAQWKRRSFITDFCTKVHQDYKSRHAPALDMATFIMAVVDPGLSRSVKKDIKRNKLSLYTVLGEVMYKFYYNYLKDMQSNERLAMSEEARIVDMTYYETCMMYSQMYDYNLGVACAGYGVEGKEGVGIIDIEAYQLLCNKHKKLEREYIKLHEKYETLKDKCDDYRKKNRELRSELKHKGGKNRTPTEVDSIFGDVVSLSDYDGPSLV